MWDNCSKLTIYTALEQWVRFAQSHLLRSNVGNLKLKTLEDLKKICYNSIIKTIIVI